MPLYEYKCPKCDCVIEKIQKFGDPAIDCPKCKEKMKRQFATPAFHFKGNGFYETDYKNKGNNKDDAARS